MKNEDDPSYSALLEQAKAVLEKNWNGQFTNISPSQVQHQQSWSAGFNAIGWAHFDLDKAEKELNHLFDAQWENGMLPHWNKPETREELPFIPYYWMFDVQPFSVQNLSTSFLIHPPVHGFVLKKIYEVAKDKSSAKAFIKNLLPKVLAQHRFLYENRDPLEEGLVYICHPIESGRTHSPTWDQFYEKDKESFNQELLTIIGENITDQKGVFEKCPFAVQDPFFNAILVLSNESLIELGGILDEDVSELFSWNELTVWSMNEKLWDEERSIYNAWNLKADEAIPVNTISGLIPLIADIPTMDQALEILKLIVGPSFSGDADKHNIFPTYSLLAYDIEYTQAWRGGISMELNWLLWQGTKRFDFEILEERIQEKSLDLINQKGFKEIFNPEKEVTEKPNALNESSFATTAAITVDFLSD